MNLQSEQPASNLYIYFLVFLLYTSTIMRDYDVFLVYYKYTFLHMCIFLVFLLLLHP